MSYPPYQGNSAYGGGGGGGSSYPPPQQGGYGPPQDQYPQPGYSHQQQAYGQQPPHHQHYPQQHHQYPPQQQSGYPPQQGYGPPPPGQYPNQQYGPPQGQYPPQQQGSYAPQGQYPAPQNQYGSGASGSWGQAPPEPPTPGYGPPQAPQINNDAPADELRRAMKGFGTDEALLIRVLAHYPALEIPHLKSAFQARHHRSLETDIAKETSGHFEAALLAILRGPLQQDVHTVHKALHGAGTNERMLNDVLLGRRNADMGSLKRAYQAAHKRPLEKDVADDLSLKTERLFSMVLAANRAEESSPVLPQAVDADVAELHRAMEGRGPGQGADQLTVSNVLATRSNGQLRAAAQAYEARYRRPLETVLRSHFRGHMEEALVEMVRAAADPAMRDAMRLEACMAGLGTKDDLLVQRVVAMHWDRAHMQQVRGAFRARYKRELVERVRGEVSGDYQRLLVAMIE